MPVIKKNKILSALIIIFDLIAIVALILLYGLNIAYDIDHTTKIDEIGFMVLLFGLVFFCKLLIDYLYNIKKMLLISIGVFIFIYFLFVFVAEIQYIFR